MLIFVICGIYLWIGFLMEDQKRHHTQKVSGSTWSALWRGNLVYAQYHENTRYCALYWPNHDYTWRDYPFGTVLCKELTPPYPVGRGES